MNRMKKNINGFVDVYHKNTSDKNKLLQSCVKLILTEFLNVTDQKC